MMSQILQLLLQVFPQLRAVVDVFNAAIELLLSIAEVDAQFRAVSAY